MCGIVGYIGPQQAIDFLIEGLRRLEYRGYDSSGVATIDEGEFCVVKTAGRIDNLAAKLESHPAHGNAGIGLSARHVHSNRSGGVGVINGLARLGPEVVDGESTSAQMGNDGGFQIHGRVIATDSNGSDVGSRRERRVIAVPGFTNNGDAPRLQGIGGKRRDVTTRHEHHCGPVLDDARVGFRDHLKAFHPREYVSLLRDGRPHLRRRHSRARETDGTGDSSRSS